MEVLWAAALGVMSFCGVYLLLRARIVSVVIGLTLLSYAVNLFIFGMGRLNARVPAIVSAQQTYADPIPQALVLTAIVIGFAMTAFVLALGLRYLKILKTDHVDGQEPEGRL